MMLEPLARLGGARQRRFQVSRLFLQRIPQGGQTLLGFRRRTRGRFPHPCCVPRHLFLQLSQQPSRVLVQSPCRAVLRFYERILDRRPPPYLCCVEFTRKLPVPRRLRGCYLLLNLISRYAQRLALCSCCLFSLFRGFVQRLGRSSRSRRNLRFRLFRCGFQPGDRFFRLLAQRPQSLRRTLELVRLLVALRCAFLREPSDQFVRELFELRRQPARQFRAHRFHHRSVRRS